MQLPQTLRPLIYDLLDQASADPIFVKYQGKKYQNIQFSHFYLPTHHTCTNICDYSVTVQTVCPRIMFEYPTLMQISFKEINPSDF